MTVVSSNVFSYAIHAQTDSLLSCSPLPFPFPFPFYCDIAKPQSYSAATVHTSFLGTASLMWKLIAWLISVRFLRALATWQGSLNLSTILVLSKSVI
jgi:hypothetical protein